MPAPIINGLITYITQQLNVTCWDGEIPRQDVQGNTVNPDSNTSPSDWPLVKVYMKEGGFTRTWTTEDPYDDIGQILIQVWGTSRVQSETLMDSIETLLAQASNWAQVPLGGPNDNPYYIISMLLTTWYSGQEEGVRTSKSELLYRCDMNYDVMIHGAVPTL